MGPRGMRSCSTCLQGLPREDQEFDDPAAFINTDIRNAFRKCAVRLPSTHTDGCRYADLRRWADLLTTVDAPITSLALPEVSKVMGWKWGYTVCLSTRRVLARHRRGRGIAFAADDSYIYAALKSALQVLVDIRQRLWEDAKLRFNMSTVKIYIPGVSRERARELILQHIDSDPSLASLRKLYDLDTTDPDLGIINVTGLKCPRVRRCICAIKG